MLHLNRNLRICDFYRKINHNSPFKLKEYTPINGVLSSCVIRCVSLEFVFRGIDAAAGGNNVFCFKYNDFDDRCFENIHWYVLLSQIKYI